MKTLNVKDVLIFFAISVIDCDKSLIDVISVTAKAARDLLRGKVLVREDR